MKTRDTVPLFGILLLMFFSACEQLIPVRPTPEDLRLPPTAVVEPAAYGGLLTAGLAEPVPIVNPLNDGPGMRQITPLVFSGLIRLDERLRPVPDLAESWSASPDDLTWTFKIRPGVRWHDGTTLTSDDLLFTYRTLLDTPLSQSSTLDVSAVAVAQADLQQVVDEIEAIDPYTLRFKLRHRFAPLLVDLALPVLPKHLLTEGVSSEVWKKSITVGTGPFRIVEQRQDQSLILDAFPEYFLGRAYLDRVAFVPVLDEEALVKALEDGGLLVASVSGSVAGRLASRSSLRVHPYQNLNFYYVGFNLRPGHIFSDKTLRQAWSYSVDKQRLVNSTLGAEGQAIWSDIPSYSWASEPVLAMPEKDLTKAHELLEAAGWQQTAGDGIRVKNEQRLSIELAVRQDAPLRINVAQELARQLREAGIEVRVTPSDYLSTIAAARRPPFDFATLLMGWTVGADPDDYYLFHSSQIPTPDRPSGYNYVGFRNDEYDRLSLEARGTTDWNRRAELYRRMQAIVSEELPYYFLWAEQTHVVVSNRLIGLPDPVGPSIWSSVASWQLARGQ